MGKDSIAATVVPIGGLRTEDISELLGIPTGLQGGSSGQICMHDSEFRSDHACMIQNSETE